MGILIPIIFIKFIPLEHEASSRIIKIFESVGLKYDSELIPFMMLIFLLVIILRTLCRVAFSFLSGKMLGKWRVLSESILIENFLASGFQSGNAANTDDLYLKINAVSKFIDKSAGAVFELFASLIIVACFTVALLLIKPILAFSVIFTLLLLAAIRHLIVKHSDAFDDETSYSLAASKKRTIDNAVDLIKEIKIYRRERFFSAQYDFLNKKVIARSKKSKTVALLPDALTQLAFILAVLSQFFF